MFWFHEFHLLSVLSHLGCTKTHIFFWNPEIETVLYWQPPNLHIFVMTHPNRKFMFDMPLYYSPLQLFQFITKNLITYPPTMHRVFNVQNTLQSMQNKLDIA